MCCVFYSSLLVFTKETLFGKILILNNVKEGRKHDGDLFVHANKKTLRLALCVFLERRMIFSFCSNCVVVCR